MTTVVFCSTNESWFPGASRLAIHSPSLSVFPPLSYFLHTWPRLLYFPLPRMSPDLLWFWRETVCAQAVAAFPLPGQSLTGSCSEVLWADTSSSVAYSRQSLESLLSIEAENMIKFWSVIFSDIFVLHVWQHVSSRLSNWPEPIYEYIHETIYEHFYSKAVGEILKQLNKCQERMMWLCPFMLSGKKNKSKTNNYSIIILNVRVNIIWHKKLRGKIYLAF